jgi:tetratricopeptide (TPR) repeat protein
MAIPRTLEERLRSGKIVPFVGAGVSMAVRNKETDTPLFPSWKQLLERAAQRLEEEQKGADAQLVRSLLAIAKPDYLKAARRARDGLGSAVWVEFLKEQLDRLWEHVNDESLNLARVVWKLGSQLVITTNYDRVLHWACPQPNNYRSWDIEAPAEQVRALRTGVQHPTIWYLQGRIDNAANLILTPDGYRHLYPEAGEAENRYRAALATLRTLLASHSLLFIGFSLDDAYFGLQLHDVHEIFHGVPGPHYALVRAADQERIRALNVPVELVPFTDFGAPLLELVRTLGDLVPHPSAPASPAVPYDPRNPVFFVPYRPKGDQVIGREESLLRVREQLTRGRRTAIGQAAAFQGLGGLGKTQLAVEYAYRYRDAYPQGVIWLNVDQDLDAQRIKISDEAGWIAPESEHKDKLAVAQQRLRTSSNCLIIFDNLEDPQVIADYLPDPQAEPHILVTSRTALTNALGLGLTLLLLQKTPNDERYAIHRLVREVHREDVPLTERKNWAHDICRRIGAWFQERRRNFTDLANFEAEIDHLRTWQEYAVECASQYASRLLWLQGYPPFPRGRIREAQELVEKALVLFEQMEEKDRELEAHLSNDLGTIYSVLGNSHALEYQEKSLVIRQELFSEQHPDTATSFNNVGGIYRELGDHQRALEYSEKALAIQQELFGERHPDTATSFNNASVTYGALGNHQRALEYQERALAILRELFGDLHPTTALFADNVACSLGNTGRRYDAFQLLEEFLHKLPKDHRHYTHLSRHRQQLLSSGPLRPGFRQPPRHPQSQRRNKEKVNSVENARSGRTEAGFLPGKFARTMERRAPCNTT